MDKSIQYSLENKGWSRLKKIIYGQKYWPYPKVGKYIFCIFMFMEMSILNNHPTLKESEERFSKTVDSVVSSFHIEGIDFSADELKEMVANVKEELKISTQ